MKNRFRHFICFTVISIQLFCAPSFADDECSAAEASPAFSENSTKLLDYKMSRDKKSHLVTESFKLADGTHITVSQGGCAHFSKSITFIAPKSEKGSTKIDTKFLLDKSDALLGKLPTDNELVTDLKANLTAQKKAILEKTPTLENGKHKLDSTDETGMNTVILEYKESNKTTEMLVGLSISL